MKIEIECKPSYGMATVTLDKGEKWIAESGAMVAMSDKLAVDTTFNGVGGGGFVGWLKAAFTGLIRKFLAGETMFVNHYKATADGQQVMLAPTLVGDVVHMELTDDAVTVQASSYLGSNPDVTVDLVWGGFAMLFSGEGAFFLKCKKTKKAEVGHLLINAYGAIEEMEIDGAYIVDSGHVVAFDSGLKYKIRKVGGWKSTLLSGEGMVLEFSGKGKIWMQTRNLSSFIAWITPFLGK